MPLACVLDLDETLGYFDGNCFQVRPNLRLLINFLKYCKVRTYLWSLGTDEYVKMMVNGFLPEIQNFVYKMYGRTECEKSLRKYGFSKSSRHIRNECEEDLIIFCLDDKIDQNMDDGYDLKLAIDPYNQINVNDTSLADSVNEILKFLIVNNIKIDYNSNIKTSFIDDV